MKYAWILSILLVMLLFFQNCSVYKSQGLSQFEQNLGVVADSTDCNPYIDTATVCTDLGCSGAPISVQVLQTTNGSQLNSKQCTFTPNDFATETVFPTIVCDISTFDANVASSISQFTTSCQGDSASTPACQQLFNSQVTPDATLYNFIPQPLPDVYNKTTLGGFSPFTGNAFAIVYSNSDGNQTYYGTKYFAQKVDPSGTAHYGASCTLALVSGPVVSTAQLNALIKITEEMAVNAAIHLH